MFYFQWFGVTSQHRELVASVRKHLWAIFEDTDGYLGYRTIKLIETYASKNPVMIKVFSWLVCRPRFSHSKACYLHKWLTEVFLLNHHDSTDITWIYDFSVLTYCVGQDAWWSLHLSLTVHCPLLHPAWYSLNVESCWVSKPTSAHQTFGQIGNKPRSVLTSNATEVQMPW